MKDIKSYVIGFLTCACLFLIMGQTKSENDVSKYQGWGETIQRQMIDGQTGDLYISVALSKKEKKSLNLPSGNWADIMYKWKKVGLSVKESPSKDN